MAPVSLSLPAAALVAAAAVVAQTNALLAPNYCDNNHREIDENWFFRPRLCKVQRNERRFYEDGQTRGVVDPETGAPITLLQTNYADDLPRLKDAADCGPGLLTGTTPLAQRLRGMATATLAQPVSRTTEDERFALACRCPAAGSSAGGGYLGCDLESGRVVKAAGSGGGSLGAHYYCRSKYTYVASDGPSATYCMDYAPATGWAALERPANRPEATKSPKWWLSNYAWCAWKSGYEWRDGKCQDSTRHLFETCWDGWGECVGDGINHLACMQVPGLGVSGARCVPGKLYANNVLEDKQCSCSGLKWFGQCSTNDCDGHACSSKGGDQMTCEYSNTDNNWRRDRRSANTLA